MAHPQCKRRRRSFVSFRSVTDVAEFTKVLSEDCVPGDGTDLAIGLGKLKWRGEKPLILRRPEQCVEDAAYLPIEKREEILKRAIGSVQYELTAPSHRKDTANIMQLRKDAKEDLQEPPMMMPTSYRQALERAFKLADTVRKAHLKPDTLLSPKIAKTKVRFPGLARPPPSPCCSRRREKENAANAQLEAPVL